MNQHEHIKKSGISLAFWLNLLFSFIEFAGGIFTNSTAIIADAFHDFMDALAIGIAVIFEKVSGKSRTAKFSYGYKRFSLLAALGMSIFLIAGAIIMITGAIRSFINPVVVNSTGMLWLAVLGVLVNGFAFLRIKNENSHPHAHAHENGHVHSHNSKAIMLHLLEDVLGWVAVLVGAAVMYFTNWYWIDGILALIIASFIGYNATKNLIATLKIFLQSVPGNVDVEQLTNKLQQINGVENIHDLHIWSLDGNYNIGSLHVLLDTADKNNTFDAVIQLMKEYNIHHPTVQIENRLHTCTFTQC